MTVAVLLRRSRRALRSAARSLSLFPEPYIPPASAKKSAVTGAELFENSWVRVGGFISDAMEKVRAERDADGRTR